MLVSGFDSGNDAQGYEQVVLTVDKSERVS
jgi:hypothetical protein